jgi:hypothetical protein
LKRFPYLIFFRILDGEIEIVAVAHAKNIDSRTSPIEGRSSPTRVCGVLCLLAKLLLHGMARPGDDGRFSKAQFLWVTESSRSVPPAITGRRRW